jgi:ribonuclease G
MSKEMYVSSSPHETKVAVLEDDQLVEVYFERDTDVGLVGGIYKGRVSRVLPGMQSAFVDIGLERDAFLYVSDFFYEDQEEYDKVFEEAEARATKFTAQQAEPPAVATQTAAPTVAETVPPVVAEVAPSPVVPSSAEPPAATVAPPTPIATPPSLKESHDRRPFDPRRGRRRRHRGRPDFGEGRHGDRRFPPPHRPEEPSTESRPFEILPGESLAKYSHAGSASPEEAKTEVPESPMPEMGTEHLTVHEDADLQDDNKSVEGNEPTEGHEGVIGAVEISVETPSSAQTVAEPAKSEPAVAPAPVELAPAAEIPALSSAEVAASPPEATETGDATKAPAPQETAEALPESGKAESALEPAELSAAEEGFEGEEEMEVEELAEGAEGEPAAEGEPPAEVAAGAEGGSPPATPEAASGEVAAATPGAPGDRTYTLREPHQRPRFAPRHRRGRRGPGPRHFKSRDSSRPGNQHPVQIAELLKEGQEILVQIAKEPLGTKGARITSHVALPGRYLVYMPTIEHIGVSRKIASEEERLRLRNIILENRGALTGGFIVRTAGQGRSEEEFKADLKFLSTLWAEIRSKADRLQAPALIHRDLDLVQRLLRDLLTPDFKCVRVDSEVDYARVLDFVSRCQPSLVGKVKLYTRDTPLFEEFGIQQELDKALRPKVWLKSGGYIVINQTEALVAIDVNTGKFVGKTNRLEDTIVKTNIDAVNEIVRQVRLRDLGGIIVIDFIDMDERKNRAKVVQALEEALRADRAPTKVISFHDFGLVAVTRKRVKQSLERTLCEPCEYCAGSGWVKSLNTVCNEILAEARKMAKGIDGNVLTLRVNPDVAKALKSREGALVSELESLTKKDVIIKSDPMVHQERFEIF